MRFMMILKANRDSEAGVMPSERLLAEIEIRQVFEADDFGAELTPESRAQEERLRARIADPS